MSEYLDVPFLLRKAGHLVVAARTVQEALDYLSRSTPSRIVVDPNCFGADAVSAYASRYCPQVAVESQEEVIAQLLGREYSVRGA